MSHKQSSSVFLGLAMLVAAHANANTVQLSADVSGSDVLVNVSFDFTPESGVIDLTWNDALFDFNGFGATAGGWSVSGGTEFSDGFFGIDIGADGSAATGVAFSFNLLAAGFGEGAIGVGDNWNPDSSFYVGGVQQSVTFIGTTANISAVPVPAAAWLFGSGLIGLVGVARRRKSA